MVQLLLPIVDFVWVIPLFLKAIYDLLVYLKAY